MLTDLFAFADEIDGEPVERAFARKSGVFRFRIHAISAAEAYAANKAATTYKAQKG